MEEENNKKPEFNEEQWQKQWAEAQEKVKKQKELERSKQQELKDSNKEKGPATMILDGDPVEQVPEDQLPFFTYKDLSYFDGIQHPKSYVSVCDVIYDTTGSGYYGPGETYHLLAGHEGSVSLAKMSFESVFLDKYGIIDMNQKEMECLAEWQEKFTYKYKKVGKLKPKTEDQLTEQDKKDLELIKTNNYENPCTAQ